MRMSLIHRFQYFFLWIGLFSVGLYLLIQNDVIENAQMRYGNWITGTRNNRVIQTKHRKTDNNNGKHYPLKHASQIYEQITEDIELKAERKLMEYFNASTSSKSSRGRKNVLFIMSDDLRPQLGSYWGRHYPNPFTDLRPHTPHLDRLAASSLLLTRAYVQYPLCGPSRASMLTGRRPDTVTTWKLETQFREVGRNFTTLPEYFKNNGYLSINLGKIFHQGHGWTNDFQSWDIPSPSEINPYQSIFKRKFISTNTVAASVTPEQREGRMLTPDESLTQNAVNYLRRLAPAAKSGDINFFLAVGYHRPHLPWVCSEEFFNLYPMEKMDLPREENKFYPQNYPVAIHEAHLELLRHVLNKTEQAPNEILSDEQTKYYRRAYFACVSFVDDMIGILLDEVDKLGLADTTIVMFLGDHGWHLGENGLWGKRTTFEQSNHTPLMMKIPGVTDKGMVSDSLVEFIDIFPTLVEAADLPAVPSCPRSSENIPLCTEGTSFLPLIHNPNKTLKAFALSQKYSNNKMGYSVKTDRYRYVKWVPFRRSETQPNVYDYHLLWNEANHEELYDHLIDPEENINLAYEQSEKDVIRMHSILLEDLIPSIIQNVQVEL